MGIMIDGSISVRHRAALRLLSDELGCSDGNAIEYLVSKAAELYLTDIDQLGLEHFGFDIYGQRPKRRKQ